MMNMAALQEPVAARRGVRPRWSTEESSTHLSSWTPWRKLRQPSCWCGLVIAESMPFQTYDRIARGWLVSL